MTTEAPGTVEPVKCLADLLPCDVQVEGRTDITVHSLELDSRLVVRGSMFAALPGTRVDGLSFAQEAIRRGASSILIINDARTDDWISPGLGGPTLIRARSPHRALAQMAARFYDRAPKTIVAVTGTSGKSSVADFLRQIWISAGIPAASLGTIGIVSPNRIESQALTSADCISVHKNLQNLHDEGVTHVVLEASSHGIDQHRLDGILFACAAFTNLGRDHLDYHPTMEAYENAKARLFEELLPPNTASVIHVDQPEGWRMLERCRSRKLPVIAIDDARIDDSTKDTYRARHQDNVYWRIGSIEWEREMQTVYFQTPSGNQRLRIPLAGSFQALNALTAAALATSTGSALRDVLKAAEKLKCVPGRLERIDRPGDDIGAVVVDYAHKPEALEAALNALRPISDGKLWLIFGCGGDRDVGKREIMGRIAVSKADHVIVTDDNPRSEDPGVIRQSIIGKFSDVQEIPDRGEAIASAIARAGQEDVVLIAGKGHESGQIVGDQVFVFDDRDQARTGLALRRSTPVPATP